MFPQHVSLRVSVVIAVFSARIPTAVVVVQLND